MAKIAVVHVPFYSHINAATRLTGVLAKQGHDVVAWAPGPCRPRIEAAGARFELHEPEMPHVDGFPGWVATLAETTEAWTRDLVQQLFEYDVDLIVHDSQVPWARVAGDYLGLPRIVSHPMFPIISPDVIRAEGDWELPVVHPEEARERFEASWLSIARRWGVELGAQHEVVHSSWASETVLIYTTEEIVGDYELPDGWHCVGPLMEPASPTVPQGDRPLVYVCFGTSFNARPELFRMVVEALADEPIEVLISMGDGMVSPADLEPLPANVVVRDFVPAREILARSAVHVTHGGCNSTHECLLAGVPMVVIPQAYDQFPLGKRIHELGVGHYTQEDPAEIRNAVRWLIEDESPRTRAGELARHLADYDGESRVNTVVEQVLVHGAEISA